jgi:CBS domain-containing protein
MQVKDVMTTKPSYCEPFWTVEAVASLMDHVGTGIVPVVEDVLSRKLIGVVTDRDLCMRVVAPGLYPAHIWVRDCMTPNPVYCHAEDDVETALQRMRDQQVRRLPVVDEHMQLKGMISISDFIRSEAVEMTTLYSSLKQICQRSVGIGKPEASVPRAA